MSPHRFIATKQHRRFVEFADAVRRQRTIGICYGQAGTGKTLSARHYAHWPVAETLLEDWGPRDDSDCQVYAALAHKRTVFYTPEVATTPKRIREDLAHLSDRVAICIEQHLINSGEVARPTSRLNKYLDMIIIDEFERLNPTALEMMRDRFDRTNIALILIGMPGMERKFSRFPQLYSRVGFAHEYRPLAEEELVFVLERRWRALGQDLNTEDFTDAQAIAAIARITRGNFRLVDRLFTQMQRIMKINELTTITDDVVEAARSTLVIGIT
ncbi:AAA family ATPase [Corynebacterium sp.]|uniref:AAA family ATPase n=1 Tax=Corynebacterium sp. TaxID=1720 RepID=UPI001984A29F|nr:AAA family ATPase [Corynebacterium sp.]HHU67253.1 AAA family ATPase [Corynebacterium sp.]